MRAHDLDSLSRDYGRCTLGLERFASIVGLEPHQLRGREGEEGFPAPIADPGGSGGSRLEYRLDELVAWCRSSDAGSPAELRAGDWALDQAATLCARGAPSRDITFRVIAAASLLLVAGWEPRDPDEPGAEPLLRQLVEAARARPHADWPTGQLPADFVPSPAPADDPQFLRKLTGRLEETAEDLERSTGLLVAELTRLWTVDGPGDRDTFVDRVEKLAALQLRGTESRRPATGEAESKLIVALARVAPGQVLLDPAIGEGNAALLACGATADPRTGAQTIGVEGRESDELTWCYAKMRFGLRGIAHNLGTTWSDVFDKEAPLLDREHTHTFACVIAEPDTSSDSRLATRNWTELVVDLLTVDGIGVLQLGDEEVIGRNNRKRGYWDTQSRNIAAVVITTPRPGATSGNATLVLRRDFVGPILLVQVHQPLQRAESRRQIAGPRARASRNDLKPDTAIDDTIEIVGEVVAQHLGTPRRHDPEWRSWPSQHVYLRTIERLTADDFGILDWDDMKIVRDAVERAVAGRGDSGEPDHLLGMVAAAPAPPTASPKDPLRDRALEAVQFLRWLIDPEVTDDPDGDLADTSPKIRMIYAAEATDEMRRSLRRLQHRLAGEEQRGRKKGSGKKGAPPPD